MKSNAPATNGSESAHGQRNHTTTRSRQPAYSRTLHFEVPSDRSLGLYRPVGELFFDGGGDRSAEVFSFKHRLINHPYARLGNSSCQALGSALYLAHGYETSDRESL